MVNIQFVPYDSFTKVIDNKTCFFITAKTLDRKRLILNIDMNPYFFLCVNDEHMNSFENLILPNLKKFSQIIDGIEFNIVDVKKTDFKNNCGVNYTTFKIEINRLLKLNKFSNLILDYLKDKGVDSSIIFENIKLKDIIFNEKNIIPFKLYEGDCEVIDDLKFKLFRCDFVLNLKNCDLIRNLDNSEIDYAINILYLDFVFKNATIFDQNNPLLLISCHIRKFTKIFQWKIPNLKNCDFCESESNMFEQFSDFLNKIKPDIIIINDNDNKLNLFNNRSDRYGQKYSFYYDLNDSNFKINNKKGLILLDSKRFHNKLHLFSNVNYKNLYYKFFRVKFDPISKEYISSMLLNKRDENIFYIIEENNKSHYNFFINFYLQIVKDLCEEILCGLDFLSFSDRGTILKYYLNNKYRQNKYILNNLNVIADSDNLFYDFAQKNGIKNNLFQLDLSFIYSKLIADNNISFNNDNNISLNKIILDNLFNDIKTIYSDEFSTFLFSNAMSSFFNLKFETFNYGRPIFFKYLTKLFLYNNVGKFIYSLIEDKDEFDCALIDFIRTFLSKISGSNFELISFNKTLMYLQNSSLIELNESAKDTYLKLNEFLLDISILLKEINIIHLFCNFNFFITNYIFDNNRIFGLDFDLLLYGNIKKNIKILEVINKRIAFILLDYDYYNEINSYFNNMDFYKEHNFSIDFKKSEKLNSINFYKNTILTQMNNNKIDFNLLLSKRKINMSSSDFLIDFKNNKLSDFYDGESIIYLVMFEKTETGLISKKIIINDPFEFKEKLNPNYNINIHYYYIIVNKYFDSVINLLK